MRARDLHGFREIGRRHGALLAQGQRYDHILMKALAEDFKDSALSRYLPAPSL